MERPHRMERRHIRDPVPPRLRTDQLQPLPAALEQRLFQRGQKHLHPRPEPHPEPFRYGQRGAGNPAEHRGHPGKLPPRRGMAPRAQPRSAKAQLHAHGARHPGGTTGKAAECGGHHHGIHDMAAHVLLAQPDRHSRGHHAEPDGPLQGFAVLPAVLRADAHHRPSHLHHHDRHPGREPLRRHQFPQSGTGGSGADDE